MIAVMPGSAQNRDPESGPAFFTDLALRIKTWARELGFAEAGITDTVLDEHEARRDHEQLVQAIVDYNEAVRKLRQVSIPQKAGR